MSSGLGNAQKMLRWELEMTSQPRKLIIDFFFLITKDLLPARCTNHAAVRTIAV